MTPALIRSIAANALPYLPEIVCRWLPDGRVTGREWESLNPTRSDRSSGSFKVNLVTGRWADFATTARGGDVVSLAAYLFHLSQAEAARRVAGMIGTDIHHGH